MFIIKNNTFVEIRDCMISSKYSDEAKTKTSSFIINQDDLGK